MPQAVCCGTLTGLCLLYCRGSRHHKRTHQGPPWVRRSVQTVEVVAHTPAPASGFDSAQQHIICRRVSTAECLLCRQRQHSSVCVQAVAAAWHDTPAMLRNLNTISTPSETQNTYAEAAQAASCWWWDTCPSTHMGWDWRCCPQHSLSHLPAHPRLLAQPSAVRAGCTKEDGCGTVGYIGSGMSPQDPCQPCCTPPTAHHDTPMAMYGGT